MSAARKAPFISVFIVASACAVSVQAEDLRAAVQGAIESYQPAWTPPNYELSGAVIALNPLGGGSESKDQRLQDDLALHTAMHLHHLVRFAGGRTVDMRVDDRAEADAAEILERCRRAGAQVLVSIVYGDPPAPPDGSSGNGLSATLARVIVSEGGVAAAYQDPRDGLMAPAVTVYFAGPVPGESVAMLWRSNAAMLYKRIAAFVDDHKDELTQGDGDTKENGTAPAFVDSRTERRKKLDRFALTIWPEGNLPVEKAAWFAEIFARIALSDRTGVYYQPDIKVDGDRVVVGGATTIAGLLDMMPNALRAVGVEDVRNEMRQLPDKAVLGDLLFGACIAPMARTLVRPELGAVPQTQLLYGEPVFVLDVREGFLLVLAGDGYSGWVRSESIRRMNRQAFCAYTELYSGAVTRDIDQDGLRIPMGARLPVVSREGNRGIVLLPDGRSFELTEDEINLRDNTNRVESVIRSALTLLYTPYVFGGRSPIGLDCSGLVTNLYGQQNLNTARDAGQQFVCGRLVATDWYREGIQPGDLLYFINDTGKIYHTGIAISSTHFIHSCPPEVQIGSLAEGDRLHHEMSDMSFLGAKRP